MIARRSGAVQRVRADPRCVVAVGQAGVDGPGPRSAPGLAPGDRYRVRSPVRWPESRGGTLGPTRSPVRGRRSAPATPGPVVVSMNRSAWRRPGASERGQGRPNVPRARFWPGRRPGHRADHGHGRVCSSGGQMFATKTRGRVGFHPGALLWTPTSSTRGQSGSRRDGREDPGRRKRSTEVSRRSRGVHLAVLAVVAVSAVSAVSAVGAASTAAASPAPGSAIRRSPTRAGPS